MPAKRHHMQTVTNRKSPNLRCSATRPTSSPLRTLSLPCSVRTSLCLFDHTDPATTRTLSDIPSNLNLRRRILHHRQLAHSRAHPHRPPAPRLPSLLLAAVVPGRSKTSMRLAGSSPLTPLSDCDCDALRHFDHRLASDLLHSAPNHPLPITGTSRRHSSLTLAKEPLFTIT